MCLFSEKWVCKQLLNDHNLLCSLQCKNIWSFDDNVKSSVITEKDNTTKFEILLTFDPFPEILIFILSVSGFTWYLMYRIISLSRLTFAPGIFPGILSKWYKLLISSWHWWNQICSSEPITKYCQFPISALANTTCFQNK